MPLRFSIVAGAALSLSAAVATAQGLPSPAALGARHDSIVGGRAVLEAHRSMRLVGTMTIPEAGVEASLEILKLRPNRYFFRTSLGLAGEVLTGFDGTRAWAVQPGQGAMLLTGDAASQVRDQADFFGDLHDYTRFATVETQAETEFEGKRALPVRMVRASGDTLYEFFDVGTGLSLGSRVRVPGPGGRVEMTSVASEYRTFGGLTIATRLEQRSPMFRMVIVFTAVEFDTLDEAAVEPPDAVKQLIKPQP